MFAARRLSVAVKMTACPSGSGSAVSAAPRAAPEPEARAAPDVPAACHGRAAGAATPPVEAWAAMVPPAEAPPEEQPTASRQAPTASRTAQPAARARRGREGRAVKRGTCV